MIALPVFFFAISILDRFPHGYLLPDFGTDRRSSQHRRSKQPWSTWGRNPDTIVNHCAAGYVEKQHREQFIQSRSNKAGIHFGEVGFAFSPQSKQAGSKPPKWSRAVFTP